MILLEQLIAQARDEKKWLWSRYQDLWFSPDQLEKENREGRFNWAIDNWVLRDPRERIDQAKREIDQSLENYQLAILLFLARNGS